MIEIRKLKELTTPPNYTDYVWSDEAGCYDTITKNEELGTGEFMFIGCWVMK